MADDKDRSENALRYDRMVEDALLSVVHRSLSYAAENGLPGEHHFYITFRTDHPAVEIPDHLRERYPGEMTIILQYQFWDLTVHDDRFSVTLSFSDVPEKLTIPFEAVAAFADPSVRFGLQFDVGDNGDEEMAAGDEPTDDEEAVPDQGAMTKERQAKADEAPGNEPQATDDGDETSESEEESGNVVTLDTFRKK